MKLLLDECVDWRLRRDLPGHEVKTVQEMGWDGIQNGRLMETAIADAGRTKRAGQPCQALISSP